MNVPLLNSIELNGIVPHPLRDTPLTGGVWNQQIQFEKGGRYLISADSGKGKSTLLNIIYGIRKDYTGNLLFDSNPVNGKYNFNDLRSESISYLFQDLRLFGQLTARENIMLKPGCKFTNAEIGLYSEKLGVETQLDKPCIKLSLGQQQRIAIIRALSQPFTWFLLDEPFSHLDANNARIAMQLIETIATQNAAGIIATSLGNHDGFDNFKTVLL